MSSGKSTRLGSAEPVSISVPAESRPAAASGEGQASASAAASSQSSSALESVSSLSSRLVSVIDEASRMADLLDRARTLAREVSRISSAAAAPPASAFASSQASAPLMALTVGAPRSVANSVRTALELRKIPGSVAMLTSPRTDGVQGWVATVSLSCSALGIDVSKVARAEGKGVAADLAFHALFMDEAVAPIWLILASKGPGGERPLIVTPYSQNAYESPAARLVGIESNPGPLTDWLHVSKPPSSNSSTSSSSSSSETSSSSAAAPSKRSSDSKGAVPVTNEDYAWVASPAAFSVEVFPSYTGFAQDAAIMSRVAPNLFAVADAAHIDYWNLGGAATQGSPLWFVDHVSTRSIAIAPTVACVLDAQPTVLYHPNSDTFARVTIALTVSHSQYLPTPEVTSGCSLKLQNIASHERLIGVWETPFDGSQVTTFQSQLTRTLSRPFRIEANSVWRPLVYMQIESLTSSRPALSFQPCFRLMAKSIDADTPVSITSVSTAAAAVIAGAVAQSTLKHSIESITPAALASLTNTDWKSLVVNDSASRPVPVTMSSGVLGSVTVSSIAPSASLAVSLSGVAPSVSVPVCATAPLAVSGSVSTTLTGVAPSVVVPVDSASDCALDVNIVQNPLLSSRVKRARATNSAVSSEQKNPLLMLAAPGGIELAVTTTRDVIKSALGQLEVPLPTALSHDVTMVADQYQRLGQSALEALNSVFSKASTTELRDLVVKGAAESGAVLVEAKAGLPVVATSAIPIMTLPGQKLDTTATFTGELKVAQPLQVTAGSSPMWVSGDNPHPPPPVPAMATSPPQTSFILTPTAISNLITLLRKPPSVAEYAHLLSSAAAINSPRLTALLRTVSVASPEFVSRCAAVADKLEMWSAASGASASAQASHNKDMHASNGNSSSSSSLQTSASSSSVSAGSFACSDLSDDPMFAMLARADECVGERKEVKSQPSASDVSTAELESAALDWQRSKGVLVNAREACTPNPSLGPHAKADAAKARLGMPDCIPVRDDSIETVELATVYMNKEIEPEVKHIVLAIAPKFGAEHGWSVKLHNSFAILSTLDDTVESISKLDSPPQARTRSSVSDTRRPPAVPKPPKSEQAHAVARRLASKVKKTIDVAALAFAKMNPVMVDRVASYAFGPSYLASRADAALYHVQCYVQRVDPLSEFIGLSRFSTVLKRVLLSRHGKPIIDQFCSLEKLNPPASYPYDTAANPGRFADEASAIAAAVAKSKKVKDVAPPSVLDPSSSSSSSSSSALSHATPVTDTAPLTKSQQTVELVKSGLESNPGPSTLIRILLLRAGVEQNPGPGTAYPIEMKDYASNDVDLSSAMSGGSTSKIDFVAELSQRVVSTGLPVGRRDVTETFAQPNAYIDDQYVRHNVTTSPLGCAGLMLRGRDANDQLVDIATDLPFVVRAPVIGQVAPNLTLAERAADITKRQTANGTSYGKEENSTLAGHYQADIAELIGRQTGLPEGLDCYGAYNAMCIYYFNARLGSSASAREYPFHGVIEQMDAMATWPGLLPPTGQYGRNGLPRGLSLGGAAFNELSDYIQRPQIRFHFSQRTVTDTTNCIHWPLKMLKHTHTASSLKLAMWLACFVADVPFGLYTMEVATHDRVGGTPLNQIFIPWTSMITHLGRSPAFIDIVLPHRQQVGIPNNLGSQCALEALVPFFGDTATQHHAAGELAGQKVFNQPYVDVIELNEFIASHLVLATLADWEQFIEEMLAMYGGEEVFRAAYRDVALEAYRFRYTVGTLQVDTAPCVNNLFYSTLWRANGRSPGHHAVPMPMMPLVHESYPSSSMVVHDLFLNELVYPVSWAAAHFSSVVPPRLTTPLGHFSSIWLCQAALMSLQILLSMWRLPQYVYRMRYTATRMPKVVRRLLSNLDAQTTQSGLVKPAGIRGAVAAICRTLFGYTVPNDSWGTNFWSRCPYDTANDFVPLRADDAVFTALLDLCPFWFSRADIAPLLVEGSCPALLSQPPIPSPTCFIHGYAERGAPHVFGAVGVLGVMNGPWVETKSIRFDTNETTLQSLSDKEMINSELVWHTARAVAGADARLMSPDATVVLPYTGQWHFYCGCRPLTPRFATPPDMFGEHQAWIPCVNQTAERPIYSAITAAAYGSYCAMITGKSRVVSLAAWVGPTSAAAFSRFTGTDDVGDDPMFARLKAADGDSASSATGTAAAAAAKKA